MALVSVAITGIQIAGAESAEAFSGQVRTSEDADTPIRPHADTVSLPPCSSF